MIRAFHYFVLSFLAWVFLSSVVEASEDSAISEEVDACTLTQINLEACEQVAKGSSESASKAKLQLGLAYLYGLPGVERNMDKAFTALSDAADYYAPAQNVLGSFHLMGRVKKQDYQKAIELFSSAAEQGYAPALNNLGVMYVNGLGVDVDLDKSLMLFLEAANKEFPPALNNVGVIYLNGLGMTEPKYAEAAEYFTKAVEQGYAPAENNLGVMHWNGWGIQEEPEEAFGLFYRAAAKNYAPAYFNVGLMYDLGGGVEANQELAANWYKWAAEYGDAKAQYNVGLKYARGEGVVQDLSEAYFWLSIAEGGDVLQAGEAAQAVHNLLTPEHIEQTEQRIRLFEQLRAGSAEVDELLMLHSELESIPELGDLVELYGALEAGIWSIPPINYVPHGAEMAKYSIR